MAIGLVDVKPADMAILPAEISRILARNRLGPAGHRSCSSLQCWSVRDQRPVRGTDQPRRPCSKDAAGALVRRCGNRPRAPLAVVGTRSTKPFTHSRGVQQIGAAQGQVRPGPPPRPLQHCPSKRTTSRQYDHTSDGHEERSSASMSRTPDLTAPTSCRFCCKSRTVI